MCKIVVELALVESVTNRATSLEQLMWHKYKQISSFCQFDFCKSYTN